MGWSWYASSRSLHTADRIYSEESGTPHAITNVSAGQQYYDQLVQSTNCADAEETLQCLRAAPLDDLWAAVNATPSIVDYQSTDLVWQPRVDGDLIPYNPSRMIQDGNFAKVSLTMHSHRWNLSGSGVDTGPDYCR